MSGKQRRRWIPALILLFALLNGCGRFYEGEYTSITPHEEPVELIDSNEQYYEVHTFVGMKNAVNSLISSAAESGTIRVTDYSGSVEDDISRACLDATRDYPLGAYAVEYISHSVNRILGYHEIDLRIRYRLSKEEITGVRQAVTPADLYTMLENSALIGRPHIALQISSLAVTERSVKQCIDDYYQNHPELLSARPGLQVTFFPEENAVTKILDCSLSYPNSREVTAERLSALDQAAKKCADACEGYSAEAAAMFCCQTVSRSVESFGVGNTAYDALILGSSGSEGCAMAFQLLCNRCGIECRVIEGRVGGNPHWWNIISLGGSYYHVDSFACVDRPLEEGFLRSDADMVLRYWWDVDEYPSCSGTLTLQQIIESLMNAPSPESADEAGSAATTVPTEE